MLGSMIGSKGLHHKRCQNENCQVQNKNVHVDFAARVQIILNTLSQISESFHLFCFYNFVLSLIFMLTCKLFQKFLF